jgi:hypothetical protein
MFEMTYNAKRKTLIFLGLVMVITMIIAASLPQLQLQPGMSLPRLLNGQVMAAPDKGDQFVFISVNKFVIILIGLIVAITTLYSIYKLLRGADWKNIVITARSMLLISMIVGGIILLIMMVPGSESSPQVEMPPQTPEPLVTSPLGAVPPVLLWVVGIGLLVMTALVGMWMITSRKPKPVDLVGLEAEKAWQALKTGLDLKDVIIKCYHQMSLALEKDRGIEREDFMTTGEFENLLETAGLPHDPIHQLTQLFDAVRYGNWKPNPADEQKAIQCLEAIMVYSRETKETN